MPGFKWRWENWYPTPRERTDESAKMSKSCYLVVQYVIELDKIRLRRAVAGRLPVQSDGKCLSGHHLLLGQLVAQQIEFIRKVSGQGAGDLRWREAAFPPVLDHQQGLAARLSDNLTLLLLGQLQPVGTA